MDGAKAAVNDTAQTPRNTTVAVSSDGHNQDVDEDSLRVQAKASIPTASKQLA